MLTRIVTALLAGSVALAAILWREPWGLLALIVLLACLAAWEAYRLIGGAWSDILVSVAAAASIGFFGTTPPPTYVAWVGGLWLAGNLEYFVRLPKNWPRYSLFVLLVLSMGFSTVALYSGSSGASAGSSFAPSLLLLALVPLWVGDSLAYFVGKAFGKHKLAPSISPNKTWEGSIANLIGCVGCAWAAGAWLGLPVAAGIAVGLTTGILGQIGDLLQSRLKRSAGVKDSGSLLPGHGGVLDRLDSFLFSSYPSLLVLWLLAPDAFHVKQWPW